MFALSAPALLLGIACAIAFSVSDFFRKVVPATCSTPLAMLCIVGCKFPITVLWCVVSGDYTITADYWVPGIANAVTGLVANLLFIVALRRSPLSLMIPMLAVVPVLVVLFAGALLGEWPTARQTFGIVLVAAGLFAVFVPGSAAHPVTVLTHLFRQAGTRPMLGVIVLWSLTPPLDKLCLERASVGVHGSLQLFMLIAALTIGLLARGGWSAFRLPREAWKPLLLAGLTSSVGYLLQLVAYRLTFVAIIELLKRVIGLAGALVLGRLALRESLTATKVAGVAVIGVGLGLVLLS